MSRAKRERLGGKLQQWDVDKYLERRNDNGIVCMYIYIYISLMLCILFIYSMYSNTILCILCISFILCIVYSMHIIYIMYLIYELSNEFTGYVRDYTAIRSIRSGREFFDQTF